MPNATTAPVFKPLHAVSHSLTFMGSLLADNNLLEMLVTNGYRAAAQARQAGEGNRCNRKTTTRFCRDCPRR